MNIKEYQEKAYNIFKPTPQCCDKGYLDLGYLSEIGELAGKLAKRVRGDIVSDEDIMLEIGDIACMLVVRAILDDEPIFISNSYVFMTDLDVFDLVYSYPLNRRLNVLNRICVSLGYDFEECLDLNIAKMSAHHENKESDWEGKIRCWADDRKLYENTNPSAQLTKLFEESLEWHTEVQNGDTEAEKLELGDMFVVLTNIANSRGFSLKECGWLAYDKIKDRTGHMENGTFVKDE